MLTAVDSNVLLDIIVGTNADAATAANALRKAASLGPVLISSVCYSELSGNFSTPDQFASLLNEMGVQVSLLGIEAAFLAGHFALEYRRRGGTRTRILADFLIAAHAQVQADWLLTRDDRFFGANFPALKAIAPEDV